MTADVVVVGGGPVGLALGAALGRAGADVLILERRSEPHRHSRSIGIHPPALAALERIGAAEQMLREGVRVRRGRAFAGGRALGEVRFDLLPGAFPFVLTLPQHRSEAILEACVSGSRRARLRRGIVVDRVVEEAERVHVHGVRLDAAGPGVPFEYHAEIVVGCDGRASAVRAEAGIPIRRRSLPDTYLMGDLRDDTGLGDDAAINLSPGGLVESFPLPAGVRRWVLATPTRLHSATPDELAGLVEERTGHRPDPSTCTMLSPFGIEQAHAGRMARGRVVLAGDSGHVVPPIGGQGMNMGWLDATDLAPRIVEVLQDGDLRPLREYEARRQHAWQIAQRRAMRNVVLGRSTRWSPLRDVVVRAMLAPPLVHRTARTFTMHGLA